MRNRRKFSLYVLLALLAGVLFASVATSISYPCPPLTDDPGSYCVSYDKAVMHPADLASNAQGSLTRFLLTLLVVSAIALLLLIALNAVLVWAKKRESHWSQNPRKF